MKNNIKETAFIIFVCLVMSSCSHRNIVQNVTTTRLQLKDVKNGKERVYDCSGYKSIQDDLIWLAPGDSVDMVARGYIFNRMFTPENSRLTCNWVELQRRKTEFENEKIKRETSFIHSQIQYKK